MGASISREGNNKKGLAIGLGVGLGVFAWPFLACLAVNVIPEGTLTTNVLTANEVTIKYSNCIGRGDKFLSPPIRAILSFSRRAHWLSCCAHGGFLLPRTMGQLEKQNLYKGAKVWYMNGIIMLVVVSLFYKLDGLHKKIIPKTKKIS